MPLIRQGFQRAVQVDQRQIVIRRDLDDDLVEQDRLLRELRALREGVEHRHDVGC